jgi:hypothetical protein
MKNDERSRHQRRGEKAMKSAPNKKSKKLIPLWKIGLITLLSVGALLGIRWLFFPTTYYVSSDDTTFQMLQVLQGQYEYYSGSWEMYTVQGDQIIHTSGTLSGHVTFLNFNDGRPNANIVFEVDNSHLYFIDDNGITADYQRVSFVQYLWMLHNFYAAHGG